MSHQSLHRFDPIPNATCFAYFVFALIDNKHFTELNDIEVQSYKLRYISQRKYP